MTSPTPPTDLDDLLELASAHGLELDGSTLRTEEVGLDFRVAFARSGTEDWVLRIPRRSDVLERADVEGRLLETVAPRLDVPVPDWRIHTPQLIAYPLLPGIPGLTVGGDGTLTWNIDMASPAYAASLGDAVAQLHAVDPDIAAATGIDVHSPAEVRENWRRDLDRVAASFEIAPELWDRWNAWVADDSFWPTRTTLTHGEIYPGHTLVQDERISGILDWTTAAIDDPAKDLMFLQVSAPSEAFEIAVEQYVRGGGEVWPRLAEHCTEMFAAGAVGYGIYALQTEDPAHREAAATALNPSTEA
ncbi:MULTISPECIES: macrolide 2'-phosphotransferase [Brachybacterium]|uniref:Aminoglycoside phosphotransferase n=1 Tax=Brachybacterium alimentarium TaxID=47845 RepID=A0A2A3YJS7_9MICO|nr:MULTISPECIES: macrolide 2'-phosphotransferase [Brachybacterium]PCC34066.1 aminoglycoside phosphotransferase [Brachybacterium alimentarium]PCC39541.1 aminoglycoside phosphotransferase [Brachybacterium alimentarium]RCS64603.1 aminoglycoside phosphotransferase [Brachybacterium sp. JB7]RCS71001.1 aminoglycoside phosphotransferase [Brachybacterium alimentarium]RCS79090.1 aminoglycoside phosphotransferase [Brachybacterium alimentarium]